MSSKRSPAKKNTLHKPVVNIHIEAAEEKLMEDEAESPIKLASIEAGRDLYDQIAHINSTFKQQTDKLVQKLSDKSKEIDNLCILLESISPVPGLDPEKYIKMLEGGVENVDYRDTKIVDLAKKCRRLQVALNKERANETITSAKLQELTVQNEQLLQDLAAISKSKRSSEQPLTASAEELEQLQRELSVVNKQLDEWKKRATAAQEEVKKLQRVLIKEVGEGTSAAQVTDEGWKGRAQQIVMLKAKVKRLEAEALETPSSKLPLRRRLDVDSKAEQGLQDMQEEKLHALDALIREKAALMEEAAKLRDRLDGSRARIQTLTAEGSKLKESLKVMIEKTESDDQLIDALKEEVQFYKQEAVKLQTRLEREELQSKTRVEFAKQSDVTPAGGASDAELSRLRRLCKQQGDQLNTQDEVIRKLKSQR